MKCCPFKKPISSKISEIRIIATNVSVAFHTILVTSITSDHPTTPVRSATTAPITAVIEISNPLGCQITKINVSTKMVMAKKSSSIITTFML